MMTTLGGSLFVRNAIKYDYCLKEAVESLSALCDKVVVLDAESEDKTLDLLHSIARTDPKIKIYDHGKWDCASNYERLTILANEAKNLLDTEWHFMLQADEVIHEDSFIFVRRAIESKRTSCDSFYCRRYNLFKNFNSYISFNSPGKPCGDTIVRLAKKEINAFGDAESLHGNNISESFIPYINIFHYGFLRHPKVMVDKTIAMQSWFGFGVDQRILKMKEKNKIFSPDEVMGNMTLDKLQINHPKFALDWVKKRSKFYS